MRARAGGDPGAGGTLPDVSRHAVDGGRLVEGWDDPDVDFLGYRVAEPPGSLYVAFLWRDRPADVVLPTSQPGTCWRRAVDTAAWMEPLGNVDGAMWTASRDRRSLRAMSCIRAALRSSSRAPTPDSPTATGYPQTGRRH